MVLARSARVVDIQAVNADSRLLRLACSEPLGFIGGQYVVVDTGLVLPSGKAIKRAYSISSSDEEQAHVQLAVKRLPAGPGSNFMHGLELGAEVRFSGPWGKLFPADGASGRSLLFATDTGITALLGLAQSARFKPLLARAVLIWLRPHPEYFLSEALVRAQLPAALAEVHVGTLPAIGDSARLAHARAMLRDVLVRTRLAQAFVAGDGAVNYTLLDDLHAAGLPASRDSLESFFNLPKKAA
jgi:ferredoxin-NADP reductase